ncbi:hypothetical protein HNQ07_000433 [Deinococcus metalli]|uniref:DNA-binding protein n=1 Tax=Deinococcus metalli TaxID=1141878 RepID=A0A7W8NLS0_9DEIO|nr:hypothetical protein [Deinococcus metalli]MBB5374989.1 hypothetical protein [Deinococcus metalli]GHF32258.1 hypothetical protein GCM10017781_06100 [Deinococcus metalli]
MTQGATLHAPARPAGVPAHLEDGEAVYTPNQLWERSKMPRDLIRSAITGGYLPAYNAGRGDKPRYLVRWADFLAWRETLRVGQK